MVRVTMADFSNCDFISALRDILPNNRQYLSWKVRVASRPEELGGHVQAAAQWVAWSGEAGYVYQQCKKKEIVDKDNPRDTWSMESWRKWRAQFEFFAVEDRLEPQARRIAQVVAERMKETENGSAYSFLESW
jgi:hypothetical protein